jgi:hypothetical protein
LRDGMQEGQRWYPQKSDTVRPDDKKEAPAEDPDP